MTLMIYGRALLGVALPMPAAVILDAGRTIR
jgi:hypothetical protein